MTVDEEERTRTYEKNGISKTFHINASVPKLDRMKLFFGEMIHGQYWN